MAGRIVGLPSRTFPPTGINAMTGALLLCQALALQHRRSDFLEAHHAALTDDLDRFAGAETSFE
jgi:hypothetical protein